VNPIESKTRWHIHYFIYFSVWVCGVILYIIRQSNVFENEINKYPPSPTFEYYTTLVELSNTISLMFQTVALVVWRLGIEAKFRVHPRLDEIELVLPGRKPLVVFRQSDERKQRPEAKANRGIEQLRNREQQHMSKAELQRNGLIGATNLVGGVVNGALDTLLGQDDDDDNDDSVETVVGDSIFLNVITHLTPSSADSGEKTVQLNIKVAFVDAQGLSARPPIGLPAPILRLHVLPGEREHATVMIPPPSLQEASLLQSLCGRRALCRFEVQLKESLLLGRHRLELQQPLASKATIKAIDEAPPAHAGRLSATDNGGGGGGGVGGSSSSSSSGGSSSGVGGGGELNRRSVSLSSLRASFGFESPADKDDAEAAAEETEEMDDILVSCNFHEVTDFTILDPEVDKKKRQALEDRLDKVGSHCHDAQ
jgi:uncharacterized membrane protein YgcG